MSCRGVQDPYRVFFITVYRVVSPDKKRQLSNLCPLEHRLHTKRSQKKKIRASLTIRTEQKGAHRIHT